jgi:Bromodomain extra-terminal - transcription regulation
MRKQCELHNIPLELPQKRQREEIKIEAVQEVLNMESKIEFAEKVKKVSHEVLAEIVKIVESDCKHALEELDSERIQIKVDSLDKVTFKKLLAVVTVVEETKPTKKHKKSDRTT